MPVETPPTDVVLNPTPTQAKAIMSDAVVVVLVGPMGSGKSHCAGPLGILVHAQRNADILLPRQMPLRCAILRDTHENIKHSIVPLFRDFFAEHGIDHQWRSDYKNLIVFTEPQITADLFGIDDLASVTRLQGTAYGYILIDDPVPYTDSTRTNAGISEDTFNAALVRCARQQAVRDGLKPKLFLASNMPDEDHWFYQRLLKPPDGPMHPDTPLITKETFILGMEENIYLSEISRQATKAAYMNDPVAYARFVEGQPMTKYPGKKVAENFNDAWHVSPKALIPQKTECDGWISFDSWGHPAALIGQQLPDGRIVILNECEGAADIRSLIRDLVKPLLQTPRWKEVTCHTWRYFGDFMMGTHDQSDVTQSARLAVEEAFKDTEGHDALCELGPQTWSHVKNGMLHTLRWTIGGHPAVYIDGVHCRGLVSALKGRWHYPVNRAGVTDWSKPRKDDASHLADCFANACCLLMAWEEPQRFTRQRRDAQKRQQRKRAASYASG